MKSRQSIRQYLQYLLLSFLFEGCSGIEIGISVLIIAIIVILFMKYIVLPSINSSRRKALLANLKVLANSLKLPVEMWNKEAREQMFGQLPPKIEKLLEQLANSIFGADEAKELVGVIDEIINAWNDPNAKAAATPEERKAMDDLIELLRRLREKLQAWIDDFNAMQAANSYFPNGGTATTTDEQKRRDDIIRKGIAAAAKYNDDSTFPDGYKEAEKLRENIKKNGRAMFPGPQGAGSNPCPDVIITNLYFGSMTLPPGCCITLIFDPPLAKHRLWADDWLQVRTSPSSPSITVAGKRTDGKGDDSFEKNSSNSEKWETPRQWWRGGDYANITICNNGTSDITIDSVTVH